MAKAKKTVTLNVPSEAIAIATGTVDDELSDLSPEERDILRALTELDGAQDAKWQIYRKPPLKPGQSEGFLTSLSSAELTMDELQARFGKGKYSIRGFRSTGGFLKQTTVEVATDSEVPRDAVQKNNNTDTKDILTIIQEREDKRTERSRELMALTIPAAITGVVSILTAVLSKPAPQQQNNVQDMVHLSAAIKGLMTPQGDSSKSTMEMMFKAMEFASKHSGKGESSTGWLDIVREGIGAMTPLLEAKLGVQVPQTMLPQPQQQLQPQINTSAQQTEPTEVNLFKLMGWAKDTLAYLSVKAQLNADASLYVDWILDNVPQGIDINEFAKYLSNENWWTVLQQFQPAVAPYQGWFAEFREILIDTLETQSETTTNEQPERQLKSIPRRNAVSARDVLLGTDSGTGSGNEEPGAE